MKQQLLSPLSQNIDVTVNTLELEALPLCYATAYAEGMTVHPNYIQKGHYRPDRQWAWAGPIMDKLRGYNLEVHESEHEAKISMAINGQVVTVSAPSVLVAICRLNVYKKFGPTVTIPRSLL